MAESKTAIPTESPTSGLPGAREVTAGPPAAQAGGVLTVDLAAIEDNWRALGRRAMPAECAAVVKADAVVGNNPLRT